MSAPNHQSQVEPTKEFEAFPGGESAPGYRYAFTVWSVLFLLVICLGFLNFIGIMLKRHYPNF